MTEEATLTQVRAGNPARASEYWHLLLCAVAVAAVHALANGQYGFHRDELDILMSARQLDWGYVAYPPLTPFVARLGLMLFGASLIGSRLLVALAQGAVALLVGLMVRDMGGARPAQLLAALAVAIAPAALTAGTLLQYMSFDFLWWVLLAFFLVRLLRTGDMRLWLGVGAAIGLGMMTKYTMAFLVAGLLPVVVFSPLRRSLRSPWLWAGAALALALFLPNLLWQIRHDFISLDFLSAIHDRDIAWGRTASYLPDQFYVASNPFVLPLWLAGLAFLLVHPGARRFRPLAWAFLLTFLLLWLARGRGYYLAPLYSVPVAAGAVWWETWIGGLGRHRQRWGWNATWVALAVGATVAVALVKPLAPLNSPWWSVASRVNGELVEMVGWPDLVAQVATIYDDLAAEEKQEAVILAGNYGEAGALDLYGEAYDLPRVISGANSLWERGYGHPAPELAIVVGFDLPYALQFFRACDLAGRLSNNYGIGNEETLHHSSLYVCRQPRKPWGEMWPTMQWFQ